ncbi:response regulator [Gaopeijia maritima]|uniref:Response regulator n=1 Tax=Gaopeijia maritima TaxID=3119007 RepID=A0ABU9EF23_9BACT
MSQRVLVVDDEEGVRRTIDKVLSLEGFKVTTVSDGNRALRILDGDVFDLLVVDIYMPDLDGIGLMRELRRRQDSTPVLAVSGGGESPHAFDSQGALAVARAFGAAVLPKPFTVDELLDGVRRALNGGAAP